MRAVFQPGVADGLLGGAHGKAGVAALKLPVFGVLAHVGDVPVADLGGDLRGEIGGVEERRIAHARLAGEQPFPYHFAVGAQGRDHANARDDNASSHGFAPWCGGGFLPLVVTIRGWQRRAGGVSGLPSAARPTRYAPKTPHHREECLGRKERAQPRSVQMDEKDFGLGLQAIANVARGGDCGPLRILVHDRRQVGQRVARPGGAEELHLGQFRQDHLLGELVVFADQQPAGLGHALDDQRVGKDGELRKVVVQIVLGQRNALDGLGVPPAFEFQETIDPEPAHQLKTCFIKPNRKAENAAVGTGWCKRLQPVT